MARATTHGKQWQKTENGIAAAVRKILNRGDWGNITVMDVARGARVSSGSVHAHVLGLLSLRSLALKSYGPEIDELKEAWSNDNMNAKDLLAFLWDICKRNPGLAAALLPSVYETWNKPKPSVLRSEFSLRHLVDRLAYLLRADATEDSQPTAKDKARVRGLLHCLLSLTIVKDTEAIEVLIEQL